MTMRNRLILLTCGLLLAGGPVPGQAAESDVTAARVIGFERFYRENPSGQVEAGRLLLGELNCLSCHTADPAVTGRVATKQAPILDEAGLRLRPEYYDVLLTDPQRSKPGTTMPAVLGDSAEGRRQREMLSHFLASLGRPVERAPAPAAVARGREHFQRIGCAACHDLPEPEAPRLATSIPLGNLGAKYSLPSLAQFLKNPLHVRPSGRMPALNLSDQEASELASYLLRDLEVPAGLTVKYYEGDWDSLPDFDSLKPRSSGPAHAFDVGAAQRRDQFGLRFEGRLQVAKAGDYTFHLGSDDGSRLWVDGRQVVDVDGIHPYQVRSGKVKLEAGEHAIRVDYFEQGGEERLTVEVEGPGTPRQPAEGLLVVPDAGRKSFEVDAELARGGREVFQQVGCASCHSLRIGDQKLASSLKAPPLADLRQLDSGCLGKTPRPGVPRYALDAGQRAALRAALESLRQPPAADSESLAIHRTLTTFNCYACHERDGVGGVEAARNDRFLSDQPEMGDEGRIPPQLTGVGDKLRTTWLQHVFREGAKDRPYMMTRMPRFGESNLAQLVDLLPRQDAQENPPLQVDASARRLKVAGRLLAGERGFSCIKCHTFAGSKASGIQALSLTTMHQRLNEGWFRRYMLNPQAYRPGTRMPAAWPNGQVLLPQILDAKASTQIHSLWVYLSDGDKAAAPIGLRTTPLELVPIDQAMIYRNFIEGAGARAIGVGFPERVHLAYDANQLRPAILWQGAFIDASRHWQGRGQGFQPPLGDNVLRLVEGVPLARLSAPDASWPNQAPREQGYRFLGYRLDEQRRPTFRYRLENLQVQESYQPFEGEQAPALRRVLEFSADNPPQDLWMRAATAPGIEPGGQGVFLINQDWTLRVDAPGTPRIRSQGNSQELLIPVSLEGGRGRVTLEYHW